jgi:predicted DNA-binding protein with PD1-like motif
MTAPDTRRTWFAHPMKVHVLRLGPGEDLRDALDGFAHAERIDAGAVLTCVGSLRRAALRFAGEDEVSVRDDRYEIVSLVGTVSAAGSHLHVSLCDAQGRTLGGHLAPGSQVHTTAEIALGVIEGLRFAREPDAETGYSELRIIE